ncbi:NADPH-dependent 7-cyano-7-deazaguanine reductase QueF [Candidatus Peregrinibacteria bacterium]|nr:NADPH-dependent 7-cyano-7-deazaguanine reductase QueF [Candidatus Peregrinibacteria bacterium]
MKHTTFTHLGKNSDIASSPDEAKLERFENDAGDILVPFLCNEFTSICPVTGQPDFAKIEILYIPEKYGVESKSLKLYLMSYRNHGAFHESVTAQIFTDLWKFLQPKFLRVWSDFSVRGGISIKPILLKWKEKIRSEEKGIIKEMIENYDRLRYFDR